MALDVVEVRLAVAYLAGAATLAISALVLAGGRREARNLLLAALFACIAMTFLGGLPPHFPPLAWSRFVAYNATVYGLACAAASPPLYLAFVGTALRGTPLGRAIGGRAARALLLLVAGGVFLATIFLHRPILAVPSAASLHQTLVGVAHVFVFAYGLAAAVDAWRRAPAGSVSRDQARRYLTAFALNDLGIILFFGTETFVAHGLAYHLADLASATATTVAAFLLAHALLRHQLFDFDLRLKWTLRRGTLVSIFLAGFFVAAAVAEQYLEQYGVLAGGVAVGLLLFALRPLERAAGRLADAAMPHVQDTAEYRTVRKREVYRAAVEGALADGAVSDKERDVLARVADQLGLTVAQALEVEREVRAMSARTPA